VCVIVLASVRRTGQSGRVTDEASQFVKVRFHLVRDADGWPPVESEGVWAEPLGDDLFRVGNSPWFVPGISDGDVVHALAGSDGVFWAIERIRTSGHMTIRVIPNRTHSPSLDLQGVADEFVPLGVNAEGIGQYRMVALDIPPGVDLVAVKQLLVDGEKSGLWDYEEGSVSEEWTQL
jgi:Domain of unknown function (DUF4265)